MARLTRWAVAAFYVLLATSASAGTILGDPQKCMYLAESTVMVLEVKAANPDMTWKVAQEQLTEVLAGAVGKPESYIADVDDAAIALQAFAAVWRGMDPAMIYDQCLRAKNKKS